MSGRPRRRRFGRVFGSNAVLMELFGPEPMGFFGLTENLGPGGCGVVTSDAMGAGCLLRLYISLHSEVLEADGRIAHERPRTDGRFDVGIEFLRMDQVHRARYNLYVGRWTGDVQPSLLGEPVQ